MGKKDLLLWQGGKEAGKKLRQIMKTNLEEDREKWADKLTQECTGEKGLWQGIEDIKREYQPNRYAREDIRGNIVDLEDRAEATKEYLEKSHWGSNGSEENAIKSEAEKKR